MRNITAQIIIAAKVAFGRYFTSKQVIIVKTKAPVTTHPTVVLTPLAWFNAVRENDEVTGMAVVKEQARLHIPKANSSFVGLTCFPLAEREMVTDLSNLKGIR